MAEVLVGVEVQLCLPRGEPLPVHPKELCGPADSWPSVPLRLLMEDIHPWSGGDSGCLLNAST